MEGNRSGDRGGVGGRFAAGLRPDSRRRPSAARPLCSAIILSRKFGHGVKTDGFFAAYGVYLALVLVAGSLRVVVLPRFVDARAGGPARTRGRDVGGRPCARCSLGARADRGCSGRTGSPASLTSSSSAGDQAAELLPWLVASAVAQIFGGIAASALAALDDYDWAAFGFALGSVIGVLVTIALRRPRRGRLRLGARGERRGHARRSARRAARGAAASAGPTGRGWSRLLDPRRRGRVAVRAAGPLS